MPVGVFIDPCAEMLGQHLRAEADAEIRLLLLQRHPDPFDLALDDLVVVVGALRAAENDRASVFFERLGQIIAESRPPHVERHTNKFYPVDPQLQGRCCRSSYTKASRLSVRPVA